MYCGFQATQLNSVSPFYPSEQFELETFSLSVQLELSITHSHFVPLSGESCPGLSPAEERTHL